MKNYLYKNILINKKQLKQLLGWSFSKYDSMQACALADELKYLGFKYATKAGISISIEDLKVPSIKNSILQISYEDIRNADKVYLKGKITNIERFQKIIDTWSITSESLKDEVVSFFKNYDPLNSVYIMAFSGARGNLSQVRQLVGMRGLMSDPSGEILKLPIKKNFREGLTLTDYLISGYGARKGIIDTALKTANSGYLTRRLIDVAQDIIIRERDCLTNNSCIISNLTNKTLKSISTKILGRIISKPVYDLKTNQLVIDKNTQITSEIIQKLKEKNIQILHIRSPFNCKLYRSICQNCYGWDLASENLVDIGESIGIIAGQSIGEPGTQLTMRTFHTGGIFTSKIQEKIVSPINGIVKFSKFLKQTTIRTNQGENVILTKNSGSLIIIPEFQNHSPVKIDLVKNTIIFVKKNEFIKKNASIGEYIDEKKETRIEIKPILTGYSGEVFVPSIYNRANYLNKNKLLWILAGKVFQVPRNSFFNFYNDYIITANNSVFRTKLLNYFKSKVKFTNNRFNLFEDEIHFILDNNWVLNDSKILKLSKIVLRKNYILQIDKFKCLLNLKNWNSKICTQMQKSNNFGSMVNNSFMTFVGGTNFYDQRLRQKFFLNKNYISYINPYLSYKTKKRIKKILQLLKNPKNPLIIFHDILNTVSKKPNLIYNSLIWLQEENYKIKCNSNLLLVKTKTFVLENFEIVPGVFSKTSGLILVTIKNNIVQEIKIKSGFMYVGKKFENLNSKVFYPGEIILNKIKIKNPSYCEYIFENGVGTLLIRPLYIYEIPKPKPINKIFTNNSEFLSFCNLKILNFCLYKSNQLVKSIKSLNLLNYRILTNTNQLTKTEREIQFITNKFSKMINLYIFEKFYLNYFIPALLRYTTIKSCFLVNMKQFVDCYTIFGYFESCISNKLEIVQFKSKSNFKNHKEICIISNEDCTLIKKSDLINKKLDNLIVNNLNVNQTGRIINTNKIFLTIQKGYPYFFPNCRDETEIVDDMSVIYKLFPAKNFLEFKNFKTKRNIFLNYYDVTKTLVTRRLQGKNQCLQFSKMFLKKGDKVYSSVLLNTLKKFRVSKTKNDLFNDLTPFVSDTLKISTFKTKLDSKTKNNFKKFKKYIGGSISLLVKNSSLKLNKYKRKPLKQINLSLIRLLTSKLYKEIGIHSITDDFFEEEVNNVFIKNGDFIEIGKTIGLLNFEKEITGDIVQGLPRIEHLLEARKLRQLNKNQSTNKKKSLLIQKTSIDSYFEFRKVGTTLKETEKINPHKFLKTYFNYYGMVKNFFCDKKNLTNKYRLLQNFEASYRSFKKVQALILNSVQTVYRSQGVVIADKHLEIIIKQMTTKVLITHQGNTSLLPREVIDLYHIKHINDIIAMHKKVSALYVPLLLGLTKASLNNPSFISAASFQETTRVLTKAAIEGRLDWLRGLKENIITGHLIPAGTGCKNFENSFVKTIKKRKNK